MKFNMSYTEGVWVAFGEDTTAAVKIKMLPLSKTFGMEEGTPSPDSIFKAFDACVVDWRGFDDENDKSIECTPDNKRLMFDAFPELVNFVMDEQNNLREKFSISLKNLPTSVPGGSKQTKKTQTK